jgi:sec-independent protein translocase protein TatA
MELFSPFHLLVILAVVILLFGGRKIPEVMRGMGEGIRSFKDGMRGDAGSSQQQTQPTLSFSAAPNPATFGQPTTLTAVVTPAPSGAQLGTISFFHGSTLLGSGNVGTNGVATLVATNLPAGQANLTAAYSGNANLTAASAALPLGVNTTYAVPTP